MDDMGRNNNKSSRKKNNENIINALLSLFCIRYRPSSNRQRRYLLYWAISVLTEEVNYNNPLIKNNNLIKNIANNIDLIYKQIKKNEKTPKKKNKGEENSETTEN